MPFEPRLVSPDDEQRADDKELGLSPDLEALAEQLRADAALLAQRYPVSGPESEVDPAHVLGSRVPGVHEPISRPSVWWPAIAVAAASVLLTAVGWGTWRMATWIGQNHPQAVSSAAVDRADRLSGPANVVTDTGSIDSEGIDATVQWDAAETLLIHVNGPELEAVLDLIETQGTEDSLLSI